MKNILRESRVKLLDFTDQILGLRLRMTLLLC